MPEPLFCFPFLSSNRGLANERQPEGGWAALPEISSYQHFVLIIRIGESLGYARHGSSRSSTLWTSQDEARLLDELHTMQMPCLGNQQ